MTRYSRTYFTDNELKCKCCAGLILDPRFDEELTKFRVKFADKMIPTSCCRCEKHNREVGGANKSFHIYDHPAWPKLQGTAAIDISYNKLFYRNKLARLAWQEGWRIGYNKHFLHLDIAHILGIKEQSIFKYDNVTDEDLERFKNAVITPNGD